MGRRPSTGLASLTAQKTPDVEWLIVLIDSIRFENAIRV